MNRQREEKSRARFTRPDSRLKTVVHVFALGLAFAAAGSQVSRAATSQSEYHNQVAGNVHMVTSCSPSVTASFDRGLTLLHSFWYPRALWEFDRVIKADPECAIAYWGAAMTYNHPFWEAPTPDEEKRGWALAQKGLKARERSPEEQMYLEAATALFKDGRAGPKSARDAAYVKGMAATFGRFPDDETKLFYALSMLATIEEGSPWTEEQDLAAKLIEQVYAHNPQNPGALHYMIHAYDDPVHAAYGLKAALAYAKIAPDVPHALHMPSHIFTRLGYWNDSVATNENAWRVSDGDVRSAGESLAYRDFHSLNYLQYAYIQLGALRGCVGASTKSLKSNIRHYRVRAPDPTLLTLKFATCAGVRYTRFRIGSPMAISTHRQDT